MRSTLAWAAALLIGCGGDATASAPTTDGSTSDDVATLDASTLDANDGSTGDDGASDADEADVAPLPPGVIAGGYRGLTDVAVAGDWVYFTAKADGLVARVKKTGGVVELLASGQPLPVGLAIAGSRVWYGNQTGVGALRAVDLDAGDAGDAIAGDAYFSNGVSNVSWVATDGTSVVAVGATGVFGVASAGGRGTLFSLPGTPYWGDVAFDGTTVFFSAQRVLDADAGAALAEAGIDAEALDAGLLINQIGRIPTFFGGGGATTLSTALADPAGIALDADYVYVAVRGEGRIVRAKKDGSTGFTDVATGLLAPNRMAINGGTLFVTEKDRGRVVAVKIADGSIRSIKEGLVSPEGIAVDDTNVYFIDPANQWVLVAPQGP